MCFLMVEKKFFIFLFPSIASPADIIKNPCRKGRKIPIIPNKTRLAPTIFIRRLLSDLCCFIA